VAHRIVAALPKLVRGRSCVSPEARYLIFLQFLSVERGAVNKKPPFEIPTDVLNMIEQGLERVRMAVDGYLVNRPGIFGGSDI
jgi:hypothetical protein